MLLALSVIACSAQVRGALARDVIRRELRMHRNELRGCYERELARRPGAEGRVTIDLTIDSDGWTRDVAIDASEVGGDKLEQCLHARVLRWRFPSMRFQGGAPPVRVRYPVVFRSRVRQWLDIELAAQQFGDGVRDARAPALVEVRKTR